MAPVGVSEFPLRTDGPKRSDERDETHVWWALKDKEVHKGAASVADAIEKNDNARRDRNLLHARLYGNRELVSLLRPGVNGRVGPGRPGPATGTRITFNVIESCAATAAAFISRSKPKPEFITDDGDAALQRRAKWLTKYVEGVFYEGKAYAVAQRAFVHACVFGTGIVHTYWAEGPKGSSRLAFEWVLPDEVLVDEEDGRYGQPQQLHRRKRVLKERLIALFPEHAKEIRAARADDSAIFAGIKRADTVDPDAHVTVTESWHLPSGPSAGDGRHAISIDGCTLLSEPYEADYFPFTFFSWKDALEGFWGVGLAEELLPIQLEIMRLCRTISESQRLACVPRVFIESTTQVVGAHLNDIPGGVVKYVGREPKIGPAPGAAPELYAALNDWIRRAYEQTGISQLQASSLKPPGLVSGVALREFSDNASGRFALTAQRWEEFFMELARKVVDMSRRRYAGGDKGLAVKANIRPDFIRTLKWKDVDLSEDAFVMKVFPTNSLPTTPAARKDTVVELMQAGMIPKEQALALLDYPDLKAYTSLATAALEDVRDTIDRVLEEGKPGEVDEMTNLQLAVQMGTSAVLRAKHRGVSEERIELLRRWVEECRIKLQESMPPPPTDDVAGPAGAAPPPVMPPPPGRAKGGPVKAGRPYVVGEGEGAETFVPNSPGGGGREPGDDRKVHQTATGTPQVTLGRRKYVPTDGKTSVKQGEWIDVRPVEDRVDIIEIGINDRSGNRRTEVWQLAGANMEGREDGGPVAARGSYVVGENGPEVFVPDQDGYIVPNGARNVPMVQRPQRPVHTKTHDAAQGDWKDWMKKTFDYRELTDGSYMTKDEYDARQWAKRQGQSLAARPEVKAAADRITRAVTDAQATLGKLSASGRTAGEALRIEAPDTEESKLAGHVPEFIRRYVAEKFEDAKTKDAAKNPPAAGAPSPPIAARNSVVLPLADTPEGNLQQTPEGHAFYASRSPDTDAGGRPSLEGDTLQQLRAAQGAPLAAPPPAAPRPKKKQRKLTEAELRRAAALLEAQMREEHAARMAQGPAVRSGRDPSDE